MKKSLRQKIEFLISIYATDLKIKKSKLESEKESSNYVNCIKYTSEIELLERTVKELRDLIN